MAWYSRRTYGDVLDNGLVLLHHKRALLALAGFERKVDRWDRLDPDLKTLATMASASVIGCSWCVDFGYYAAHSKVCALTSSGRCRDGASPTCSTAPNGSSSSSPRR